MDKTKFCPNCGSDNVLSDLNDFVIRHGNLGSYRCGKCGYTGPVPEGENDENIEFENEEKYPPPDARFGEMSSTYQKITLGLFIFVISFALGIWII